MSFFLLYSREKERQPLDVIPMGVGEENRELDRLLPELLLQVHPKRPDPGAGIEDDQFAVGAHLHATGVSAITHGAGAGNRDGTADTPEFDAGGGRMKRDLAFIGERAAWSFGHDAVDGSTEIGPSDGLDQIFVGAGLDRALAIDAVIAPGNDDDLGALHLATQHAAHLKAVGLGHEQVAEHHIRPMVKGELDAGLAIARLQDRPLFAGEKFGCRPSRFVVVFDHKYGGHRVLSFSSGRRVVKRIPALSGL